MTDTFWAQGVRYTSVAKALGAGLWTSGLSLATAMQGSWEWWSSLGHS